MVRLVMTKGEIFLKRIVAIIIIIGLFLTGCEKLKDISKEQAKTKSAVVTTEEAKEIIDSIIMNPSIYLDAEGERELNGEIFYDIRAYSLGVPEEDGARPSGTFGWFVVDKNTGLPYLRDINTEELLPLNQLKFIEINAEQREQMMQIAVSLFPELRYPILRFVERDKRQYCIIEVPNQPVEWTHHNYFFYDLISEKLFRWDVSNDTLTR